MSYGKSPKPNRVARMRQLPVICNADCPRQTAWDPGMARRMALKLPSVATYFGHISSLP